MNEEHSDNAKKGTRDIPAGACRLRIISSPYRYDGVNSANLPLTELIAS
jgi:hypothetical protein